MRLREPIAMTILSFALTALVAAQQPASSGQQKPQSGGMMSMEDMMKECRKHCEATTSSIDRMTKTIEEAKQSNDPAKAQREEQDGEKRPSIIVNQDQAVERILPARGEQSGRGAPSSGNAQTEPCVPALTLADLERMALQANPTLAQAEAAIRAVPNGHENCAEGRQ